MLAHHHRSARGDKAQTWTPCSGAPGRDVLPCRVQLGLHKLRLHMLDQAVQATLTMTAW